MEENPPGFAAIGSGGMDTVDSTLIERGEPSSCAEAGDRSLVHLNLSISTACSGDARQRPKVPMFLWRSQNDWSEMPLPRNRKRENLSFRNLAGFQKFPDLANEFQEQSILRFAGLSPRCVWPS